ncbi:hypothetical protein ACQY0O_007744 [Thecaphora frezii]
MAATPASQDNETFANDGFGLSDRATPTTCHRKGQAKEFQPAPGAPPPWPGFQAQAKMSNLPRNLPVKRYDGDPLGRADVQHALLCYLFADTRRVFTNPRPGDGGRSAATGVTTSNGAGVPTPVWPYGTSQGCLRRSDETPEELQRWKDTKARYDRWKRRMAKKADAARAAEEKSARDAAAAAAAAVAAAAEAQTDPSTGKNNEEVDELDATAPNDGQVKPTNGAEGAQEDKAKDGADDDLDDESEPLDENEFPHPGCEKLTFKELYIEALLNSGKCTKSMRDKIVTDEEYAEDFAKVCLLVNVGRINTTLAFYPEMKTVLRSYHPLPSVQNNENTRRNMQDAPRMKSLLKAVLLDNERPSAPTAGPAAGQPVRTPKVSALSEEAPGDFKEVIKRYRDGTRPPTSVVTLIFLLSLHANDITAFHFPAPHDSHALFYPHADYPLPARQRAEAFLWLLYHYLEGPATQPPGELENPFDDEHSRAAAKQAWQAWESLGEEEKKKQSGAPWKGLVNPEWLRWKQQDDRRRAEAEAAEVSGGKNKEASAAAAASSGIKQEEAAKDSAEAGSAPAESTIAEASPAEGKADGDGDVSMKDADQGEKGDAAKPEEPAASQPPAATEQQQQQPDTEADIAQEPPSHLHRLLVPALDIISYEQAARENLDSEEEIRWGKQMQSERAAFLARFQEEEAAKNAAASGAASPAPSTGTAGGGRRKGGTAVSNLRRDDFDRGGTPSDADGSFAARNRKRAHPLASSMGSDAKRSRIASIGYDDSPEATPFYPPSSSQGGGAGSAGAGVPGSDEAATAAAAAQRNLEHLPRLRPSLWELDLSLPRHQMHESLPQLAWARILDRAQRGVGDACYESDDEEFANEEALVGERSRGEVWRILKSIRACVPEDVFREDNEAAQHAREDYGMA